MKIIEKAFVAGRSKQSWERFKFENVTDFTKAEVVPLYANFILSNPSDEDVKDLNNRILTKWSNRGLLDIKTEAWKIVDKIRSTQKFNL